MRIKSITLGLGLWLLAAGGSPAAAAGLAELEALAERWLALRSEEAAERRSARETAAAWGAERALLEAEREALLEEASASGRTRAAAEARRERLRARRDALRGAREEWLPVLEAAEQRLQPWIALAPPGQDRELASLSRLWDRAEGGAAAPPAQRLQAVLAFLDFIEERQQAVRADRVLLETGEGRREAEVLFLGWSRAFAVTADGSWAAVGAPGPAGWTWTPRPELASSVRRALRLFERADETAWIDLPLGLADSFAPEKGEDP